MQSILTSAIDLSIIEGSYGPQVAIALEEILEGGDRIVILIDETLDPFALNMSLISTREHIFLVGQRGVYIPLNVWYQTTRERLIISNQPVIDWHILLTALRTMFATNQIIGVVADTLFSLDDQLNQHHRLRQIVHLLLANPELLIITESIRND
ncbi:hypothetical protein HGA91_05670 [candidate division WWE3 bacterium]|nr:hypothetical protein [candidate division WWE3 bacterium]